MPAPLKLELTYQQRTGLERQRQRAPKAYLRERAAALLKIADGQSARQVAAHGLLKPHSHRTICEWVNRFNHSGLQGLEIKPGRGRKPSFSPKHESTQSAQQELLHLLARAPEQVGQSGSRWKLQTVQNGCEWMSELTLSGVWRLLDRLSIHLKRARDYLHSPDPNYVDKLADIVQALELATISGGKIVLLFSDELTFYRQPSIASNWVEAGASIQPLARRSFYSNTSQRVVSALNAVTGQLTSMVASKIGVKQAVSFYQQVRLDYRQAEIIYLVEDNWPVHYHADVIAALEPQQTRWGLRIPPDWSLEPSAKAQRLCLPIQILPLPTYASWFNPIEKLWRWMKQDMIHLHRKADEWPKLKEAIKEFLDRFIEGSQELLRYVGLTPNSKLCGAIKFSKTIKCIGCAGTESPAHSMMNGSLC